MEWIVLIIGGFSIFLFGVFVGGFIGIDHAFDRLEAEIPNILKDIKKPRIQKDK